MEETTTLDHSADVYEPSLTPDSLGKFGMWLFLISDAMSFGALLASYGAVRAGAAEWIPPTEVLGIQLTAGMTFLLICSSVTMVKALEAIQNGNQSRMCTFLGLTILCGVIFLGLQAYEWTALIKHGLTLTTIPASRVVWRGDFRLGAFWSNLLHDYRFPRCPCYRRGHLPHRYLD